MWPSIILRSGEFKVLSQGLQSFVVNNNVDYGPMMAATVCAMLPVIEQATAYLREAGVAPSRFWAYVLVQDVADAHQRVLALEEMGITAFAQPYRDYNGGEPPNEQKAFARWVNIRSVHNSCTWENYNDARRRTRNGR